MHMHVSLPSCYLNTCAHSLHPPSCIYTRAQVSTAFGVSLPDGAPAPAPAPSAPAGGGAPVVTTLTASSDGIEGITVGLPGSFTLGALAQRFKLEWPGPDDLVSVSNPSLIYTQLPLALGATMSVSVPALGVSGALASLFVKPGGSGVQLTVRASLSVCIDCARFGLALA